MLDVFKALLPTTIAVLPNLNKDDSRVVIMSEEVILRHAKDAGTDFLMYTGNFCGYCEAAKRLFSIKNLTFTEYNFEHHSGLRQDVVAATGHRTVPVIFDLRGGKVVFIGGFDETNRYLR
tara:strand:+ start:592 stop:951 length:360 start_codon:yes stop_codon:yes gene_type:complete